MTNSTKLDARCSGVYRAPRSLVTLARQAHTAGFAWFDLKLSRINDKEQFLAACAKKLKFPGGFGGNWDALADCLRDFGWCNADGYVLHAQNAGHFARAAPDDYALALEILRLAADYWKEKRVAFIVLVDGDADLHAL